MGWVIGLLAVLVLIAASVGFYVCYMLEQMNERLADLQAGIVLLRRGE